MGWVRQTRHSPPPLQGCLKSLEMVLAGGANQVLNTSWFRELCRWAWLLSGLSSITLGTFGLPCRAHPGAVPRCLRSPKRRQPAEASNTRPLMSLSDVACEGSHMRYFGGLVSCPPYNLPLLRVWSQRSTARSLVWDLTVAWLYIKPRCFCQNLDRWVTQSIAIPPLHVTHTRKHGNTRRRSRLPQTPWLPWHSSRRNRRSDPCGA